MGSKEIKALYEQVDTLSFKEKRRLLVYLQEQPKQEVKQIITQEELDMIYAVAIKHSDTNSDE